MGTDALQSGLAHEECEMRELLSRPELLQASSGAALTAGAIPISGRAAAPPPSPGSFRGTFRFFSKPVPQLSWLELARALNARVSAE